MNKPTILDPEQALILLEEVNRSIVVVQKRLALLSEMSKHLRAVAGINWFCDGSGPHLPGEVRVLSYPGGSLILCHKCFDREMEYRKQRNSELSVEARFTIPLWDSLKVYSTTVHDDATAAMTEFLSKE